MKKILTLILIVIIAAAAVIFFLKQKSGLNSSYDIGVRNTSDVTSIFLADMKGNTILLIKKNSNWYMNDTVLARQDAVDGIFDVLTHIKATQPVPNGMHNGAMQDLGVDGIKVEVYASKKLLSAFTIGGASQGGTYNFALKAGADRPYCYEKMAYAGDLRTYFFTDKQLWRSKCIMNYAPDSIASVYIHYADSKDSSFELLNTSPAKLNYLGAQNVVISASKMKTYLTNFEKHYCLGYENQMLAADSIRRKGRPYGYIAINSKSGAQDTFRLVYFKGDKRCNDCKAIEGVVYDMEFMYMYTPRDLMSMSTSTLSKVLLQPSYFAR